MSRVLAVLTLIASFVAPATAADDSLEARAKQWLAPVIESGTLKGISIGVIRPDGEQFAFGLGPARDDGADSCGPQTIFEIGSITKVFTALLLADMVERGEVKLDDTAQKYLSDGVKLSVKGDKPITLASLSSHTSGLPRLPNNLAPKDAHNPYADYSEEQLYAFLTKYKMRHVPGERVAYSNLGVGLLGHLLARRADKSYEALVIERVCRPLGMDKTSITLSDAQQRELAQGHDADGAPENNWDLNVLQGAGALRSSANDMLKFLAAASGRKSSPLDAAFRLTEQPRAQMPGGAQVGLGWHLSDSDQLIWHNGGTGGYRSFCGFRADDRVAVVVLANSANDIVDVIGFKLIDLARGKSVDPLAIRQVADVAEEALERHVGKYSLAGVGVLTITREGKQVYAQLTGQPRAQIFAEGENEFFYRAVDAQITFEPDENGGTAALVLHQGGQDLRAVRQK